MTIRRRAYRNGHAYFNGDRKIPGVTTIIGAGLPKPALVDWAARTTAEYAIDHWADLESLTPTERLKALTGARWETSRAAMGRGTDIHTHAERLNTTGSADGVPEALLGPVQAYADWLKAWDVQVVCAELVIVNYSHGYAGTLDLIADIAGQRWLLDAKTGKGVFPDAALQLAAYRYAEKCLTGEDDERDMIRVDRTGVVHIGADNCQLIPVEAGSEVFRRFLYVQQVAAWADFSEGLISPPVDPPGGRPGLEIVR